MANGVAVFALLCSFAAMVFGVWRYRQVRATTRAAARDRMDAWRAEMALFEAQATTQAAQADEQGEAGKEGSPAEPCDPSATEPATEPATGPVTGPVTEADAARTDDSDAMVAPDEPDEPDEHDEPDEPTPVDVRAEMDAFFGGAPASPRTESDEQN